MKDVIFRKNDGSLADAFQLKHIREIKYQLSIFENVSLSGNVMILGCSEIFGAIYYKPSLWGR